MANFFSAALLLFILFLFAPIYSEAATASSKLISSIDCGATKPYTDELGIAWVTDSSFIKTGSAEPVPNAESQSQAMQTLRAFPAGKRNCYSLSIPGGGQVLVRATFFYGNYDGKSSPPTFNLEFDGNMWTTVETASNTVVGHEIIYAVTGGSTSVCVVQTKPGDVPFVSALEVRALDDIMYSRYDRSSSALVLFFRTAVGLPQALRYPDDPYDRIWSPFQATNSVDVIQNQATSIDTGIKDSPPAAVLQSAVTTVNGGDIITFPAPLPSYTVSAYINMYFTEVAVLRAGDNRTFQIYVDDTAVSNPLVPPFQGVTEFYMSNVTASSSTQISLHATADATLPPVISALEAYVMVPVGGGGGGGGGAPDAPAVSYAPPSDGTPSDAPPTDATPSDESPASDQGTGRPVRSSPGSAFGGGNKATPSDGNKMKVGGIVGTGLIGLIFPVLMLNSL